MGVCISEGPKCQQAWIDQGKLSSHAEAEAELCLSGQESDGKGFGSRPRLLAPGWLWKPG